MAVTLLLNGCSSDIENLTAVPLTSSPESSGTLFDLLDADEIGIEFLNELKPEHRIAHYYVGAGLTAGDCDGNGLPDLYLVSQDGRNKLFSQSEPWKFTDVTDSAGVDGGDAMGSAPAFVDVDNDGDLDLHVSNLDGPDLLYINDGKCRFREEAAERGTDFDGASIIGAFADYDRDGDLDYYLLTYRHRDALTENPGLAGTALLPDGSPPAQYRTEYRIRGEEVTELGREDLLFQNQGDGTFRNVSNEAGIAGPMDHGLSATWWDYNDDLWPDLYVTNDYKGPDYLYHNNGDGTFTDVIADAMPFIPWFSMGSDFGDLDGDGRFDLVAADMLGTTHYRQKVQMGDIGDSQWFLRNAMPRQYMRNTAFINSGAGRFYEASYMTGFAATDWTWAVRIADLDNDGREDVYFANGMAFDASDSDRQTLRVKFRQTRDGTSLSEAVSEIMNSGYDALEGSGARPPLRQNNLAFRNHGNLKFEDASSEWGLDLLSVSFGAVLVDIDNDGDLDLAVNNMNEPAAIYRNNAMKYGRAIVRLTGTTSNRHGLGARVTIEAGGERQVRWMTSARGYQSADPPTVHFGLGSAESIRSLTVEWPSGAVQRFEDLPTDHSFTIRETAAPVRPANASAPTFGPTGSTRFTATPRSLGLHHSHQEQPFDDYRIQALLPYQLSRLGPGMAWGDIDGDSVEELYTGGGYGQPGTVFRRQRDGAYRPDPSVPWNSTSRGDAQYEDMGAVWFDADGRDGLDLYVVSGGVEQDHGSAFDRIYLGDSAGRLRPAPPGTLPWGPDAPGLAGSSVAAADFDRDGDVDLFVGTRVTRGAYPTAGSSFLLMNDGGHFRNRTAESAPELESAGMVTSSLWTDVDDDGWMDLLVATEWGPIRLYRNREGRLVEATDQAGLAPYSGWWNGLAAGDVDADGDIDYVATNFGLNTKYQIKEGKPRLIYYGDLDGDGSSDLVEAKYDGDQVRPERGLSCSRLAMPMVGEQFETFHEYALSDLEGVYSEERLRSAKRLECHHLESSVLLNDGTGRFRVVPLPRRAQISPAFGVVLEDFDADGALDLAMTQNFYPNQIETGFQNMGLGLYLRGIGDGTFEPEPVTESGVYLPGDTRSMTTQDIDRDGWPDLAVTVNHGEMKVLRNTGADIEPPLAIRLQGQRGNAAAAGSRVLVTTRGGRRRAYEVHAGGSYLGQSSSVLRVPRDPEDPIRKVTVRWSDGRSVDYFEGFDRPTLILRRFPRDAPATDAKTRARTDPGR